MTNSEVNLNHMDKLLANSLTILIQEGKNPVFSEKLIRKIKNFDISREKLLHSLPDTPCTSWVIYLKNIFGSVTSIFFNESTSIHQLRFYTSRDSIMEFVNQRYQNISSGYVFLVARDSTILATSLKTYECFGEDLSGSRFPIILDRESILPFTGNLEMCFTKDQTDSIHVRMNGSYKYDRRDFSLHCSLLTEKSSIAIVTLNSIVIDNSLYAAKSQNNTGLIESLLKEIPLPSVIINREGWITEANIPALRLAMEVVGRHPDSTHFSEWIHPEYRKRVEQFTGMRFNGKFQPARYSTRMVSPHGEVLYLEITAVLLPSGEETLILFSSPSDVEITSPGFDHASTILKLARLMKDEQYDKALDKRLLDLVMIALNASGAAFIYGGKLITTGEVPILKTEDVRSVSKSGSSEPIWKSDSIGSWNLIIPVRHLLAVSEIRVYGKPSDSLSPLESFVVSLIPTLVDHFSAIKNTRLVMHTMKGICELGELLVRSEISLKTFLKNFAELLEGDLVLVTRISENGEELIPVSGFGYTDSIPSFPLKQESLQAWVFKHGELTCVSDAATDIRYSLTDESALSEVCVPLRVKGSIIGTLSISSRRPDSFLYPDIILLRIFSVTVSLWIANSSAEQQADIGRGFLKSEIIEVLRKDIVASLSHKLRTPLSTMRGHADMLLSKRLGELNDEQSRSMETLSRSLTRLVDIVDRLLAFIRMELGTELIKCTWGKPADIVQQLLPSLRERADLNKITIDVKLPEEPITALFDSGGMEQILYNLIDNSIKFGKPGGNIEIEINSDGTDFWSIEVRDDGSGIPSQILPNIFDRFYRGSQDDKSAGLGIGLTLVKQLTELQGGNVTVWSQTGKGTRFLVRFPTSGV